MLKELSEGVWRLLACVACLLPATSFAQLAPYVPSDLSRNEIQALELTGAYDPALAGWKRLNAYALAKENFRRTALMERCPTIKVLKPDELDFDPAIRAALDGAVDKMRAGKIFPITPQDYRRSVRLALWAQRHSDPAGWQALVQRAQNPVSRLALQRLRAILVMDEYSGLMTDVSTGATLAYPPIALKSYFTQSGQLDLFERALQTAAPALRASFARVRTVKEHTDADFTWLRELNEALDKNMPAISDAFGQLVPEMERKALDALLSSPFYRLYDDASYAASSPFFLTEANKIDAPKFRGMVFGDRGQPNYREFVRASLESEYPQSKEQYEAIFRLGPRELIDYAHRPFCPKSP